MKKNHLATLLPLLLALFVFSTLFAITNGQDLRGQIRIKTDKTDKKNPEKDDPPTDPGTEGITFEIRPQRIPRCKRTWVQPVSYIDEHYYNNDHVLDIGLTAFENEMMNLDTWNNLLDTTLESSMVDNIELISANFDNNNADWIITRWSADVFDDSTGTLSGFGSSFLSEQNINFNSNSNLNLVADVDLNTGATYRIVLDVPEMYIILQYFADVTGTFDFGSATIGNQTYLMGNAKEMFGETEPVQDTTFEGYDFEELAMGFSDSSQVTSILAVNDQGETSEPTDLITVAILENLITNNLKTGGIFLGYYEGYPVEILSETQTDNILGAFSDAFGIIMGRQLKDKYGYVTNLDLLRTHWIEDRIQYENALICDYGQSVSQVGTIHPASLKPGVPYVENGIDHNF